MLDDRMANLCGERKLFSPANNSNCSFWQFSFCGHRERIFDFCDYRCRNSCSTRTTATNEAKTCTRNSRNVPKKKKIIKNPGKKRFSYWQSRERLCSSTKQTKSSIKQHKNCVFEFPWRNIEHSQKIRRNTKQKRKGETLKSAGCWASFHLTECQH